MNVPNGATADSESFAHYHIPRITLHSVTPETWSILHSSRDKISAVKMNDYYDSYKLIAEYLAYLDESVEAGEAPSHMSAAVNSRLDLIASPECLRG